MKQRAALGFDFGASSGRGILGFWEAGRLRIEEVHRFANEPVRIGGELVWDFPRLFYEMKQTLTRVSRMDVELCSIGVDTWGSDFGLVDAKGHLVSLPVHYRDARNNEQIMRTSWRHLPREVCYALTGSAYEPVNTAMQLFSMAESGDPRLRTAERLMFMADLFAYALTGVIGTEYTIATTSQMLDPLTGAWRYEVMDSLGIPRRLLPERPQKTGSLRGLLLEELAAECDLPRVPVFAVGEHDTGSAVAAVPARESSFAFLSSGTISLIGAVVPEPVRTRAAMEANYTNEGCVDGSTRLLNNISGLWTLQECRREWERRGLSLDFIELARLAGEAEPYRSVIDVGDPLFFTPGDMPGRIQSYCRDSGQEVPGTPGEIARLILEGLALQYRRALEDLEGSILRRRFDELYIVGGGSRNRLLDQLAANCARRPVIAGPGEATAIGNLLVQAKSAGLAPEDVSMREVVRASFETERFEPCADPGQDEAYALLKRLRERRGAL